MENVTAAQVKDALERVIASFQTVLYEDDECYNGGYRRPLPGDRMLIPKASLSSDWSLQPDSMKLDSLVIAHQPWRGEYVPGPCTHRPSSHESRGYLKYVTARSVLG